MQIVFFESKWQDSLILGKTVKRHMFDALGVGEAHTILGRDEDAPAGEYIALTLDMPLITREDLDKYICRMRAKGIGELRLGGESSPARICLSSGGSGFFANDDAFLQIVDAKSHSMVYNHLRSRIVAQNLARGVEIPFADSVVIDCTAKIEAGAKILPFSRIEGDSRIRSGAEISASLVRDSEICSGASVETSHIADSFVGERATIGPFARLRGANIAACCRIGDFVEVKASSLGDGAKAAHLAYIGDAEVGARTNIGCGTVFCNYDGKQKHPSKVGEDCFIGANANLVAPIYVGDGAFIAAGTTLTEDVPQNSFSIGRARQTTKTR